MNAQEQSTQRVRVAAFVVGTLAVLLAAIFVLGHSQSLFSRKVTLHTSFANTAGLITGSAVRLAGVDIGIVKAIRFDPNIGSKRVDVDLSVSTQDLNRIRADSVAQVDSKGLLGDMIVNITLGSEDKPALKDGDHLASAEASGIAEVVSSVQGAIKGVNVLVSDVDDRLRDLITPQVSTDFGRIAHSAAAVMDGVEHGHGLVHALVYEPALADSTGQVLRDIQRIARRADSSMVEVQQLLTDARTGDGLVHSLVYDKKGGMAVAELEKVAADLSAIVDEVKDGHGLVHSVIYEQDKTNLVQNLSEVARILRQLAQETNEGKGTVGGLIKDPTAYEDLTTIFGNLKRNDLLKALIRLTIVKDDLNRPSGGRLGSGANAPGHVEPSP